MTLLIGKKTSKFYSYRAFQRDSLIATGEPLSIDYEVSEYAHKSYANPLYSKLFGGLNFKVFRNYPANKITFIDMISTVSYLYDEDIPIQEWKIQQDRETISGYKCQKAICHFRGRNYVAWFTDEIPINNGPYKFGGLPGLIVQISDTKSHHYFQLIRIERAQETILFEKRNYIKIKRKNYARVYRNFIQRMTELMKATVSLNSNTPAYVWNSDVIEKE
jgi:GLPGLI family protein